MTPTINTESRPVTTPIAEEYRHLLVESPRANQLLELWEMNKVWKSDEVSAYLARKSLHFRH
jgi:hypothetical protein